MALGKKRKLDPNETAEARQERVVRERSERRQREIANPRPAQTQWLRDRLADRGYSIRGASKVLGHDPTNMSRWLLGQHQMYVPQVVALANLLNISTEECIVRLGYDLERDYSVPIAGVVDSSDQARPEALGSIRTPGIGIQAAYVIAAPGHPFNGGLLFVGSPVAAREWVGKMALARSSGTDATERLCTLEHGISREPGQFKLTPVFGADTVPDVKLETVRPVTWVKF